MAYETKPNTTGLFKNSYKQQGDRKPDYKGKMLVDLGNGAQREMEVAVWNNDKGDNPNRPEMTLKLNLPKPKVQQQDQVQNNAPAEYPADDPFASEEKPPF